MQKIVICKNDNSLLLSRELFQKLGDAGHEECARRLNDEKYWSEFPWDWYLWKRDDPLLVKVIEEHGNNPISHIGEIPDVGYPGRPLYAKIVEVPDGVKWHIGSFDFSREMGKYLCEYVFEDHRTWD